VIESDIKRVVIGTIDPFAEVAGRGIKRLIDAGIDVTVGVLEKECLEVNKRFFTFHEKKRPYIILKWAESKDGFIAPKEKEAQEPVWITNIYSRQLVHKWRSEEQGILVGANTVIADNPSLTTRDWEGTSPTRIVLDTKKSLPKNLAIFNDKARTIIIDSLDPTEIVNRLYNENIQSVIMEGGTQTLQRFIDASLWDEARVFTGNTRLTEGTPSPTLTYSFYPLSTTSILEDSLTIYKNNHS